MTVFNIAPPNWAALMPNVSKHEAIPEKETPMTTLAQLQHDAQRAIDARSPDAEYLLEKFEKAVRHRVTVTSHDDGEADGKDEVDQQLEDLEPDDDESNGDEQEDPDEDDDEEDEPVRKAYTYPYGQSSDRDSRSDMYSAHGQSVFAETKEHGVDTPKFLVRADHIRMRDGVSRNEAMQRAKKEAPQDFESFQRWKDRSPSVAKAAGFDPLAPRGRSSVHPSTQNYTTSPAVGQPKRNVFDDIVDAIQRRDNCTRTTALQRARSENPSEYSRYQGWLSSSSAQDQQARRSTTDAAYKSAVTYEDAVAAEIRKGCTTLCQAEQRVLQMHGNTLPRAISKGVDVVDQFNDKVSEIASEGYDLVTATQIAARENPTLMKYMR
jgi:hypothetical protein